MITNNFKLWRQAYFSTKTQSLSENVTLGNPIKDINGTTYSSIYTTTSYGDASFAYINNGNYTSTAGVSLWLGTNAVQESVNDYQLQALSTSILSSQNFICDRAFDGDKCYLTFERTFVINNTTDAPITIAEVGLVKHQQTNSGNAAFIYLAARAVIPEEKRVTVPAGTSVTKTFTMVIEMQ